MQGTEVRLAANEVVFREGEPALNLYFLKSGKVLVCTLDGTKVKTIARISAGEFIGELSFFDGKTRASSVVTLEPSQLIQFDSGEVRGFIPKWYGQIGEALTKKIRLLDKVVHSSNLKLSSNAEYRPLTITEQREIHHLLTN